MFKILIQEGRGIRVYFCPYPRLHAAARIEGRPIVPETNVF